MPTFKDTFIDSKKDILIPALQRDYVQGGRSDVINQFLDELISAIKGEKKLDLNYVYGSFEENSFVPVDGQQRLITLWLLHLYLLKKQGENFQVKLKFNSREFAAAFSEKLLENLQSFSNSIKNDIIDSPWFVSGWRYDVTVCNMLNTLNLVAQKCTESESSNFKNYDNITFSFLDLKTKQLTDDIYIKMNGRGRPLSYFENLKSWMDGKIIQLFGTDDDFTEKWQTKIDNEWTNFFWENRNQGQEYPEEIDDEQERFLYTMILLYWIQNESKLDSHIKQMKEPVSNLNVFLNLAENNEDIEAIKNKLFEILREDNILIPLYWIEKLALIEERDIYEFIFNALEKLCDLNTKNLLDSQLDKCLNFGKTSESDTSSKTSLIYRLSMQKATYETTLPYLFALIKTPASCMEEKNFIRWMCLFRNLIQNSYINRGNLVRVLDCISYFSEVLNKDTRDFYIVISECNLEKLTGFNSEQIFEEMAKAKQITRKAECEENFRKAEEFAFFKGAIRFLFRDENGKLSDFANYETKKENAKKYFDENGVKDETEKYASDVILLRAFISHLEAIPENECIFDNEASSWKNILLKESYSQVVNDILLGNVEQKNSNNSEIERLCNDKNLLKYLISEGFKCCRKRWIHNHYALYPNGWSNGIFLDCKERDNLLHSLEKEGQITIEKGSGQAFDDFIFGWYVVFKLCKNDEKLCFQWYPNGTIYLLKNRQRTEFTMEFNNIKHNFLEGLKELISKSGF